MGKCKLSEPYMITDKKLVYMLSVIALIAIGLIIEKYSIVWGQFITNVLTYALLITTFINANMVEKRLVLICFIIAFLGEYLLSIVLNLYEYRLGNLPLFVPAGHALIFLLIFRIRHIIKTYLSLVALTILILLSIYSNNYGSEIIFFSIFIFCLLINKKFNFYVTMLGFALILEIYGTNIGSWAWSLEIPFINLKMNNPPIFAGAIYCTLDILTLYSYKKLYLD